MSISFSIPFFLRNLVKYSKALCDTLKFKCLFLSVQTVPFWQQGDNSGRCFTCDGPFLWSRNELCKFEKSRLDFYVLFRLFLCLLLLFDWQVIHKSLDGFELLLEMIRLLQFFGTYLRRGIVNLSLLGKRKGLLNFSLLRKETKDPGIRVKPELFCFTCKSYKNWFHEGKKSHITSKFRKTKNNFTLSAICDLGLSPSEY